LRVKDCEEEFSPYWFLIPLLGEAKSTGSWLIAADSVIEDEATAWRQGLWK
jgi:hypothetical protein